MFLSYMLNVNLSTATLPAERAMAKFLSFWEEAQTQQWGTKIGLMMK